MRDPKQPPTEEIREWLTNMDRNTKRFIEENRPCKRDLTTAYLSQDTLDSENFLKLLCKSPPFEDLAISVSEMREFCRRSDVWRAFAAMLAYTIKLWATHAPRKRRPGDPDLWQAVYLGIVEVFVSSDTPMRKAVSEINVLLRYPRRILSTEDFIADP